MAWYPGARKMELQPESDAQPAIRPTQLIVHSIVAPWTAQRTYEYWRDSTNLESHFGLGYAGDLAQYIGTETRADANAGANLRADGTGAVSIETASNTSASDPWTDEQVAQLVALGVWMHQHHQVPLRICRTHDDPGYGYHRLHAEWSTSGTSCPGDARVTQFREVVFPGIVAAATATPTPDVQETDVPQRTVKTTSDDLAIPPRQWKTLGAEGNDLLKAGSTGAIYDGAVHLTLTGVEPGTEIQGRFYHNAPDGKRKWTGPIVERAGTGGSSFVDFAFPGRLSAGELLRFELLVHQDEPCTAVTRRATVHHWAA